MDNMHLREEMVAFLKEEDGVGVIEVVLILVVLIGLVIIFKGQINKLLEDIFKDYKGECVTEEFDWGAPAGREVW